MPAFIKTKEDERLWQKAKDRAEEQGRKEDWAYITGIFKNMKGGKVSAAERVAERFAAEAPDYGAAADDLEKLYHEVQATADACSDFSVKIDQIPPDAYIGLQEVPKYALYSMRKSIKKNLAEAKADLEKTYEDFRKIIKLFDKLGG